MESLRKALLPLGKVDSVLVHVTQFWGDFARAADMMVKNTKTTNLFAGLKTQNQIDQLYNSLDIVEYVRNSSFTWVTLVVFTPRNC